MLGELWLDLCIRDGCGAKQHEQRQSVEMVPDPHPLPPCRSLAQTLGANICALFALLPDHRYPEAGGGGER